MHYFDQSAANQLANVFLIVGCGFLKILIQNTSFYGGETRAHGVPFHERIKKVKNKNLHNYSNISTPYYIRLTYVGVEGVTYTVPPSRLSK